MGYALIKKVISYLIIASIFISGNGIAEIGFTIQWYYFVYVPFAIAALVMYHKFSTRIAIVLGVILVYTLITFQYGLPLVFKQIINISFSCFVFYSFLVFENFDFDEIARKYISFSKVILVLGFIQVFLFSLDFIHIHGSQWFLYFFPFLRDSNISVRYQSITQEPSFLAYAFAPVVFLSLHNLLCGVRYVTGRTWSLLFVAVYLLTFSIVAYAGLVIMLLIIYFKHFTMTKLSISLFFLFGVGLLCWEAYRTIPEIKIRTDDTFYGITHDIAINKNYEKINFTTYAFLSNVYVTVKSLDDHPLFGTGLGTYEMTYDKYLPAEMRQYLVLNREEANSMGLRLLTETGVIGFLIFCFFLVKYKIRAKPWFSANQEFLWILNSGILVMMILFLIRHGNYTSQGRILFMLIYYYTFLILRKGSQPA